MFGLGNFETWSIAIGLVVFGLLLVGLAVYIAATMVDWEAIKVARAAARSEAPKAPAPPEPAA